MDQNSTKWLDNNAKAKWVFKCWHLSGSVSKKDLLFGFVCFLTHKKTGTRSKASKQKTEVVEGLSCPIRNNLYRYIHNLAIMSA